MSQGDRRRRSLSQSQPAAIFASLTRKPRSQQGADTAQEAQQAAFKTSKRFVLEQVRNDWFYEPYSPGPSTPTLRPDLERDVARWTPREQEDTSGSEGEGELRRAGGTATTAAEPSRSAYRVENPDGIEPSVLERKRKKRKLLEDEMQWNHGLRNWVARRDAWTGARPPPSLPRSNSTRVPLSSVTMDEATTTCGSGGQNQDIEMLGTKSRETSYSQPSAPAGTSGEAIQKNDDVSSPNGQAQRSQDVGTSSVNPCPGAFEETLVPVLQPERLYGDNVRPTIRPSSYSAIYSRLVVQSNSPAVPINLKHVTRALVHGWKQNGEWPPRPTPRIDVPAFKRRNGSAAAAAASPLAGQPEAAKAEDNEKAKRRSGSFGGAVKRVFSLTSGRRLHRNSNSRDNEEPPKEHTAPLPP